MPVAIFLMIYQSSYKYLIHYQKWKISFLLDEHERPQLWWLLKHMMPFYNVLESILNHIPLKHKFPFKMSNRIRPAYLKAYPD